jgi:hypothetical protein
VASPKRHHYLPEFYLKGFARDDLLWVFDRKSGQYRQQPPKNTAVIGQYYTSTTEAGEKDTSIEKHLADIEGEAKPIIDKLDAAETISPQERVGLAYFLALQLSRTPKHQREIEYIGDAAHKLIAKDMFPTVEAVAASLKAKGGDPGFTPESFFEFVHKEQFKMQAPRDLTLNAMLDHAAKFYRDLALMNWFVFHADGHTSFITTDSPLGYVVDEKHRGSREPIFGFASEKVTKLIPLTCQTTLAIAGPGVALAHVPADRNQVREINLAVTIECERFVIARDEKLLRSLVPASKVDTGNPGTRMRVENVPHPTDPLRSYMITRRVTADEPDTPFPIEILGRPSPAAAPSSGSRPA